MFYKKDFDEFKKMENIVRINFLGVYLEDLLCEMDDYLDENDICESDIACIYIDFEVNPFKKLSLYYKK